ncbi:ankyrin repeat-containing domain protein [Xylaria sp. FL1777]|nr:ankyrin repeat-containing domain protein [Xylaria sp. FL1777]
MEPLEFVDSYPFLGYSAQNWCAHFVEACFSKDADILPSTLRICDTHSRSLSTWYKIYYDATHRQGRAPKPGPLTSLLISSVIGLEAVVRLLLLENNPDLESKDIDSRTPLSRAAGNGHAALVQLLIEYNANIESKDITGRTPLLLADENGHQAVFQLLLRHNAKRDYFR